MNQDQPDDTPQPFGDCGKRRYPDKKAAISAINAAWKRRGRGRRPKTELRAYHCHECGGWHITHQTRFHREPLRSA